MRIADMRTGILIQKATTTNDEYDNRVSTWVDYFRCWATAVQATGDEYEGDASTRAGESINFTVRCCSEMRAVKSQGYRIVVEGQVYDIDYIDRMADKGNSLKIHATLHRRKET